MWWLEMKHFLLSQSGSHKCEIRCRQDMVPLDSKGEPILASSGICQVLATPGLWNHYGTILETMASFSSLSVESLSDP